MLRSSVLTPARVTDVTEVSPVALPRDLTLPRYSLWPNAPAALLVDGRVEGLFKSVDDSLYEQADYVKFPQDPPTFAPWILGRRIVYFQRELSRVCMSFAVVYTYHPLDKYRTHGYLFLRPIVFEGSNLEFYSVWRCILAHLREWGRDIREYTPSIDICSSVDTTAMSAMISKVTATSEKPRKSFKRRSEDDLICGLQSSSEDQRKRTLSMLYWCVDGYLSLRKYLSYGRAQQIFIVGGSERVERVHSFIHGWVFAKGSYP